MSQTDVHTLWNVISQQRNETQTQFLLCMILKALEKHSNMFILHVFKQTWQWNYYSMNIKWLLKCYWKVENVVEVQRRWRVEFVTPSSTRVTITRIRDKFEVAGTGQDVLKGRCGSRRSYTGNESADASCRFLHDPQRGHWGNVLVRLVSRNTLFIEFWTCHQWYSINNNADGMSFYSTSLLGVYCGRR